MKKRINIFLFAIAIASLFLMGQTGCSTVQTQQGTTGTTQTTQYQSTSASSYGLDFSLIPGVGFLSEGSKITLGESFNVGAHIENFDSAQKSGTICVKDDVDDAYGGVESPCTAVPFYVGGAQTDVNGKVTKASSTDIIFPSSGYYSYHEFPFISQSSQGAKLFVELQYPESTTSQASIAVPQPQTETVSFQQPAAPVTLGIEKTVTSEENNYRVNMKITFTDQMSNTEIWTPDFKKKGLQMQAQLSSYPLDCSSGGTALQGNYVDMQGGTKFITCSALVPKEQITHVLLIKLDYGVKLDRTVSFTIQKEAIA